MRRVRWQTAFVLWGGLAAVGIPVGAQAVSESDPVVVASKPFAESYLLAEMFAQTLEAAGLAVDRRPGLGATEVAFEALRSGAIDVYPEYTGTGLLAVLGESPDGGPRNVYLRVRRAFADRWDLHWLAPLGFENTYAIAVRPQTADSLGLRTLSDLAARGGALTGGFSPDFLGREDGLPGLAQAYGMELAGTRSLLQAVKYEALLGGRVDVIDGYSTDGQFARFGLTVMADDLGFFPPYEASALVGARLMRDAPEAVVALGRLSGLLDEERMRALNERVGGGGEPVERVAQDALEQLGVLARATDAGGEPAAVASAPTSFPEYMWQRRFALSSMALRHLLLVGLSLVAATLVAVPAGVALQRQPELGGSVVRAVGLLQTIPGIALLAFMIPLLGIGVWPALVALFLYALLPILQNTYTGVSEADPNAVEAARALGMTRGQIARHVRLPLAAPVILAGIRTAAVISVGTATLAAFIGAGGLGDPIVAGLALNDTRRILSGALPAAVLAFLVDLGLGWVERRVAPRGLRG